MKITVLVLSAILLIIGSDRSQAFQVFTSKPEWDLAVREAGPIETFDNAISNSSTITFSNGVVSSGGNGNQINSVDSFPGGFVGAVDGNGSFPGTFEKITWKFPQAIAAFGGYWADSPISPGLNVSGDFDGQGIQTVSVPTGKSFRSMNQFFGVVGSAKFTEISFTEASGGDPAVREVFKVDNFQTAAEPVPEPITIAGSFLALGGLAALKKKYSTRNA